MQSEGDGRIGIAGAHGRAPLRLYISVALLIYGALGVAVHLRLLTLVVQGLVSWLGLPAAGEGPMSQDWLAPLQRHFDALPWLPWAAWLVGAGLLASMQKRRSVAKTQPEADVSVPTTSATTARLRWLAPAILLFLLLVAGYARMAELWPQDRGISQLPYDDEGVYAGASQLFLQGILPYRDYFFAHPPIAALSYAPALAYHFNEWGSPTSFMMARYLSVAYSLVTLAILFFIGLRLVGLGGGTVAAALWAVDGRVVEINRKVMLDGPMVLLSCAALLLYLWARPAEFKVQGSKFKVDSNPRRPLLVLALVGACATLSALTKVAGVACLGAILADMIWLAVENRSSIDSRPIRSSAQRILSLLAGAIVAALLVLGPFLIIAPSQFVRDVFFFQILRPSDGLIDIPARIADLTATLANPLTPLFAALGFILLTLSVWRRRAPGPWRVVALWTFFSLLLFTYSRSFYSHYYIQLAAPLCLLGAGASLFGGIRDQGLGIRARRRPLIPNPQSLIPLILLIIVALPLLAVQWLGVTTRHEDRIFEIVGRYVNNAVPPGTPVLSTDEQFNFLAARPPSHSQTTGYLVDSYGHMISIGLGLNTRDWSDLWAASLRGEHSNDAYAIMQRPAPQADVLDRAAHAVLVVIHQKGFPRLTPATLATIEAESTVAEQQTRYTVFRVKMPR